MELIQYEHYMELRPAGNWLSDLDETFAVRALCAKFIDPSHYKDISDEKAAEILARQEQEEIVAEE